MIWTGTELYHAQYGNGIQQIDINTGQVLSNQSQPDVVGMSFVGGQIWITQWSGREVGIWNPTTNAFTPEFSTPSNAGGLAYDPTDGIMWVGLEGGSVVPYTLAGVQLNGGFQPFGEIDDTIDGLAFLGESAPSNGGGGGIPEPSSWALMVLGFGGLGAALRSRRRMAMAVA
ncbi:PEPxxWA-CTERM sorting domain-containing protein [Phenylobacterium sp.]|uniref:PEPxxWA-CTERM sorting domain-containing protein n=1 Tax=Phenylobacterium sp. TaxID=1871053 RepID=UPI0012216F43|nr:PEPxxWA-CTERM sorting domain-containing protein [Phenylobacterium sp.]THD59563.1 MAG: PEP-CTERM sorting domain-containing protein [Phenylobacterium sp.]